MKILNIYEGVFMISHSITHKLRMTLRYAIEIHVTCYIAKLTRVSKAHKISLREKIEFKDLQHQKYLTQNLVQMLFFHLKPRQVFSPVPYKGYQCLFNMFRSKYTYDASILKSVVSYRAYTSSKIFDLYFHGDLYLSGIILPIKFSHKSQISLNSFSWNCV